MRSTGWYIPYWRKPKKKSKPIKRAPEPVERTEEQLEAVRRRWVERYRRTMQALRVLHLSMGTNREEVQARYEQLLAAGTVSRRELDDAYRYILRVLPLPERRKRRSVKATGSRATVGEGSDTVVISERSMTIATVEGQGDPPVVVATGAVVTGAMTFGEPSIEDDEDDEDADEEDDSDDVDEDEDEDDNDDE